MSVPDGPSGSKKHLSTTNSTCQVCGERATIVNYGALSCLSCRTFFRRNGSSKKV
jgi:hypothetical protein